MGSPWQGSDPTPKRPSKPYPRHSMTLYIFTDQARGGGARGGEWGGSPTCQSHGSSCLGVASGPDSGNYKPGSCLPTPVPDRSTDGPGCSALRWPRAIASSMRTSTCPFAVMMEGGQLTPVTSQRGVRGPTMETWGDRENTATVGVREPPPLRLAEPSPLVGQSPVVLVGSICEDKICSRES